LRTFDVLASREELGKGQENYEGCEYKEDGDVSPRVIVVLLK
jgi:hypothetical protein